MYVPAGEVPFSFVVRQGERLMLQRHFGAACRSHFYCGIFEMASWKQKGFEYSEEHRQDWQNMQAVISPRIE